MSRDALEFPESDRQGLEQYLPPDGYKKESSWVTLTYAMSLDSAISIGHGKQTALSGPQSKAMTHYLRSRHDAILIGITTAVVDNPSLNCRLNGVGGYGAEGLYRQPRPIVIDPDAKWDINESTKILQLADQGRGRAPYVICISAPTTEKKRLLENHGGKYIQLQGSRSTRMEWQTIFSALHGEGLNSIMVEGGAVVIRELLQGHNSPLLNSVIITIAPTWLGENGVKVTLPQKEDESGKTVASARLHDVTWIPLGEDTVLCGRMRSVKVAS